MQSEEELQRVMDTFYSVCTRKEEYMHEGIGDGGRGIE